MRLSGPAFRRDGLENWHFGRWVAGAAVLLGIVDLATVWLLAGFVSVAAAGAWRAVIALMGPTHLLLKTMDTTLTPLAARVAQAEGPAGLRHFLWKIAFLTAPAMLGWCLLVSAFPAALLAFFYGRDYSAYAWLLPVGALSYALSYSNKVVTIGLVSRRLSKPIFRSQLLQTLFFLTFGIGATYFFGMEGAAAAIVGASLVQSLELWRAYLRDPGEAAPRDQAALRGDAGQNRAEIALGGPRAPERSLSEAVKP